MSMQEQFKYSLYRFFCFLIKRNSIATIRQSVRVNIIPTSDTTVEIIEEKI